MAEKYLCGQTLDDVLRSAIEEIQLNGERIYPSKGPCTELTGMLLEITDPRSRLSRTETRGKFFSCLGELCWYLAGTNALEFVEYYIPDYRQHAEDGKIFGGYGPRLLSQRGLNQLKNVAGLLRRKPDSRQAVIQLFDANDIAEEHKDVPCTCILQFMIRGGKLHQITYMRSNDVFLGLPHDVFSFTMLQEIMARELSVELGTYTHTVGSLHLYDRHRDKAQQFLSEGWQSTEMSMPPMPLADPWPPIQQLLGAEAKIRAGALGFDAELENLDPYWMDLVRLLQIFRYSRDNNVTAIEERRKRMSSDFYDTFIEKKLSECHKRINPL